MRTGTLSLGVACVALLMLAAPAAARADDTITRPGDHPRYLVEIEPQGLWGFTHYDYAPGDGFGAGGRFSIPVLPTGLIPGINDSLAIGVGADWLHYSGSPCTSYQAAPHLYTGPCYYVGDTSSLQFPVVAQWNLFVASKWSVFAEPGMIVWHSFADPCANAPAGSACVTPTTTGVDFAFWVGGRYHVSDRVALVMRVGYPTFSFGVSFM